MCPFDFAKIYDSKRDNYNNFMFDLRKNLGQDNPNEKG